MKPEELQARMAHGDAIAVLDVRTKDARRANPVEIPASIWIPLSEVVQQAGRLPRHTFLAAS